MRACVRSIRAGWHGFRRCRLWAGHGERRRRQGRIRTWRRRQSGLGWLDCRGSGCRSIHRGHWRGRRRLQFKVKIDSVAHRNQCSQQCSERNQRELWPAEIGPVGCLGREPAAAKQQPRRLNPFACRGRAGFKDGFQFEVTVYPVIRTKPVDVRLVRVRGFGLLQCFEQEAQGLLRALGNRRWNWRSSSLSSEGLDTTVGRRKITSSVWLLMRSCWPNTAPMPSGRDKPGRPSRAVVGVVLNQSAEDHGLAAADLQQRFHFTHLNDRYAVVDVLLFSSSGLGSCT